MIKQYIVKDDLTLVDAKDVGIWKTFHQSVNHCPTPPTEENIVFINLKELCDRLSMAQQSIYNKINTGIFIEGVHFFKPTGGKLLFKWAAMLEWVENKSENIPPINEIDDQQKVCTPVARKQQSTPQTEKQSNSNFINI